MDKIKELQNLIFDIQAGYNFKASGTVLQFTPYSFTDLNNLKESLEASKINSKYDEANKLFLVESASLDENSLIKFKDNYLAKQKKAYEAELKAQNIHDFDWQDINTAMYNLAYPYPKIRLNPIFPLKPRSSIFTGKSPKPFYLFNAKSLAEELKSVKELRKKKQVFVEETRHRVYLPGGLSVLTICDKGVSKDDVKASIESTFQSLSDIGKGFGINNFAENVFKNIKFPIYFKNTKSLPYKKPGSIYSGLFEHGKYSPKKIEVAAGHHPEFLQMILGHEIGHAMTFMGKGKNSSIENIFNLIILVITLGFVDLDKNKKLDKSGDEARIELDSAILNSGLERDTKRLSEQQKLYINPGHKHKEGHNKADSLADFLANLSVNYENLKPNDLKSGQNFLKMINKRLEKNIARAR